MASVESTTGSDEEEWPPSFYGSSQQSLPVAPTKTGWRRLRVHRHQDLRQEAAGRVRCRGHQPLDVQHRWVAPEVQQVLQAGVDEDGWDTRYMR